MGKHKGLTTPRKKEGLNDTAKVKKKKTRHSIFENSNNVFNLVGSAENSHKVLSSKKKDKKDGALVEINLNLNAVDKWIGKPYLSQLKKVFKNSKISELAEEYLRPYFRQFQKSYLDGMVKIGIECAESKEKLLLPSEDNDIEMDDGGLDIPNDRHSQEHLLPQDSGENWVNSLRNPFLENANLNNINVVNNARNVSRINVRNDAEEGIGKWKIKKVTSSSGWFLVFPYDAIEKKFEEVDVDVKSVLEILKSELPNWKMKVLEDKDFNADDNKKLCDHGTDDRLEFDDYIDKLFEIAKFLKTHPDEESPEMECRFCICGMSFYCLPCNGNILRCGQCTASFREYPAYKFCRTHLKPAIPSSLANWNQVEFDSNTFGVKCKGGLCGRDYNARILSCGHMFHLHCLYMWIFLNRRKFEKDFIPRRAPIFKIFCIMCKQVIADEEWNSVLAVPQLYLANNKDVPRTFNLIRDLADRAFDSAMYKMCVEPYLDDDGNVRDGRDVDDGGDLREDVDEDEKDSDYEDSRDIGQICNFKLNRSIGLFASSNDVSKSLTDIKCDTPYKGRIMASSMSTTQKCVLLADKEADIVNSDRAAIDRCREVFTKMWNCNTIERLNQCMKLWNLYVIEEKYLGKQNDDYSKKRREMVVDKILILGKIIKSIERGKMRYNQ